MLRIATKDDLPLVLSMSMKFAATTKYAEYIEQDKVREIISKILDAPKTDGIVILYEDKGMLIAAKAPFIFGSIPVATEIAWWVEPELRKQGVGDILVAAYEQWALTTGCKMTTLAFLDSNLTEYMKKKGYEPYESAHYKVI